MPTHAMTRYTNSFPVNLWKIPKDGVRELLGDVAVHVVSFWPRLLCSIDIEACTGAKVPVFIFVLDSQTACAQYVSASFLSSLLELVWLFPGIDLRGLVSGYRTAIPCLLAACWKKPFSAQLSPVHVKPAKYIKRGKLEGRWDWVWAGMKRLKFISHFVVEALCASLRSLPPKQAMELLVCKDIDFVLCFIYLIRLHQFTTSWDIILERRRLYVRFARKLRSSFQANTGTAS